MRDYAELINDLREADENSMCGECGLNLQSGSTKKGILFADAADAIEELQKVLNVVNDALSDGYDVGYWAGRRDYEPKWISVEERLPEKWKHCLLRFKNNNDIWVGIELGYLASDGKTWSDTNHTITHWMPLPEAPKEVE